MARRTSNPGKGTSRTQRGAGRGTDIGAIIARAQTTGVISTGFSAGARPLQYLDLTSVDFMTMNNMIVSGRQAFAALPSRIRSRFQNDPYQLLRFVENEDNREEAIRLGLITPETPRPKRIHEMTADEWIAMERRRDEVREEANPRPKGAS